MDHNKWNGKIKGCAKQIPNCMCCNLHNNYIAILPDEFKNTDKNISHLKIIKEDRFGGKIVVCTKQCRNNDLKPLDCKSFPYFPIVENKRLSLIKSKKCPLSNLELKKHFEKVFEIWKDLLQDEMLVQWIKSIKMPESYQYCFIQQ